MQRLGEGVLGVVLARLGADAHRENDVRKALLVGRRGHAKTPIRADVGRQCLEQFAVDGQAERLLQEVRQPVLGIARQELLGRRQKRVEIGADGEGDDAVGGEARPHVRRLGRFGDQFAGGRRQPFGVGVDR